VNVGVAPNDHLGRPIAENIERRLARPVRDEAVRIPSEFGAAEVESDDLAAVPNVEEILPPHGHLPTADVEIVRLKPRLWKGASCTSAEARGAAAITRVVRRISSARPRRPVTSP
jgi:hypothetical protein